jgi:hypothetical protein
MPSQLSFLLLVARARRSGQRHDAPLLLRKDPLMRAGAEKAFAAQSACQDGHPVTGVFLFHDQDAFEGALPFRTLCLERRGGV